MHLSQNERVFFFGAPFFLYETNFPMSHLSIFNASCFLLLNWISHLLSVSYHFALNTVVFDYNTIPFSSILSEHITQKWATKTHQSRFIERSGYLHLVLVLSLLFQTQFGETCSCFLPCSGAMQMASCTTPLSSFASSAFFISNESRELFRKKHLARTGVEKEEWRKEGGGREWCEMYCFRAGRMWNRTCRNNVVIVQREQVMFGKWKHRNWQMSASFTRTHT